MHVASEAFAPKCDQVVPDHRDLEHRLDVALAQLPPGHFPEFSSIIATDADPPGGAREDLDGTPDVGPGKLLQRAHRPFAVRIRLLRLRGIARVELSRLERLADDPPPVRHYSLVGLQVLDVRVAPLARVQASRLPEPLMERRVRQGNKQVRRHDRDLGSFNEFQDRLRRFGGVGVQPEDNAGGDLDPITVERVHGLEDWCAEVLPLAHGSQSVRLHRLDAAEDIGHERFAHERQDLRVLGDVQRELAGEADRIVTASLPFDEVRQEVQRAPGIPNEVVVHEVDRRRPAVGEFIEFGQDLLRAFEPWVSSVKRGDVTELAGEGTATRVLDASEQVLADVDQVIGGCRKLSHRKAVNRPVHDLLLRARHGLVEAAEQIERPIAHLATMEEIDFPVVLGRSGDRGTAERNDLACAVCAARQVKNLSALDMHARHEDGVGPGQLALHYRADVLVDEPDLPFPGHERRNKEDALWWHEGLDGTHQRKSVIEGAKSPRVGWKDTKDAPDIRRTECPYGDRGEREQRGCRHERLSITNTRCRTVYFFFLIVHAGEYSAMFNAPGGRYGENVAVRAAEALLDRGYGRPVQGMEVSGKEQTSMPQQIKIVFVKPGERMSSNPTPNLLTFESN